MPSRLNPIGWLAKYLIVPVLVAAVGFLFVGPRVGKDFLRGSAPLLRKKIESVVPLNPGKPDQESTRPATVSSVAPSTTPPESVDSTENDPIPDAEKPDADVSVSVRPAPAIRITSPPPFHRRKRKPRPPEDSTKTAPPTSNLKNEAAPTTPKPEVGPTTTAGDGQL
jgi:FtsZ-interacting cell division protein ZipA